MVCRCAGVQGEDPLEEVQGAGEGGKVFLMADVGGLQSAGLERLERRREDWTALLFVGCRTAGMLGRVC